MRYRAENRTREEKGHEIFGPWFPNESDAWNWIFTYIPFRFPDDPLWVCRQDEWSVFDEDGNDMNTLEKV